MKANPKRFALHVGFLALLLTLALCPSAHALVFNFTIIGTSPYTGTATGTLTGLSDNTPNQVPTSITITANGGVFGTPYTFLGHSTSGSGFSVSGGNITAANYFIEDFVGGDISHRATFNASTQNAVFAIELADEFFSGIMNHSGFSGATYTQASPVPEPSDYGWALVLAVAAFAGWRRFSPAGN